MSKEQEAIKLVVKGDFTPDKYQRKVLAHVVSKFADKEPHLTLLRGYAGTGKTSIISVLVSTMKVMKRRVVLLAPTGRAAKVMSQYSGKAASTIHRHIYEKDLSNNGRVSFALGENKLKNTLFIIDEVSMIGTESKGDGMLSGRSLMHDLLYYIYSAEGCSALFVGDFFQLPPVGQTYSPALDIDYMKSIAPVEVSLFELSKVYRQEEGSEILGLATDIRAQKPLEVLAGAMNGQVKSIYGMDVLEELQDVMSKEPEDSIIITRSNKLALKYNQAVRNRVLWFDTELDSGDRLMVVKNNYFWLSGFPGTPFVANGDVMELKRIITKKELYNQQFARADVEFPDYPELGKVEVLVLLDSLASESPSLTRVEQQNFFDEVRRDYEFLENPRAQVRKVMMNEYFQSLQVKFAYAITGHKSQGGQWKNVFVDCSFLNYTDLNEDTYRWLYTAFTRAKENLYVIGWPQDKF